jgi:hypothetical protein
MKEKDLRLTVVARRLDRDEPLVWNGWTSNAGPSFAWNGYNWKPVDGDIGGLMVTGLIFHRQAVGRSPLITSRVLGRFRRSLTRFGWSLSFVCGLPSIGLRCTTDPL